MRAVPFGFAAFTNLLAVAGSVSKAHLHLISGESPNAILNRLMNCWKQWRTDESANVLCPSGLMKTFSSSFLISMSFQELISNTS